MSTTEPAPLPPPPVANGAHSIPEQLEALQRALQGVHESLADVHQSLEQLHGDLDVSHQTNRALIDVLCDLRDDFRYVKPLAKDARTVLADLSGELRAMRIARGGELSDLDPTKIP